MTTLIPRHEGRAISATAQVTGSAAEAAERFGAAAADAAGHRPEPGRRWKRAADAEVQKRSTASQHNQVQPPFWSTIAPRFNWFYCL